MNREIDLKQISDGKLYGSGDMVKAGCGGCAGCFACCAGMGKSVVLDPLDAHRLKGHFHTDFEGLLAGGVELHVEEGVILPNLKMVGKEERCAFLNGQGRCSVHPSRPGVCRIFPLGRLYENGSFRYFLQVRECPRPNRTKVKVSKWMDVPDTARYERFVNGWHYFLKGLQDDIAGQAARGAVDDGLIRQISLCVLEHFYVRDFDADTAFYPQFWERLEQAEICAENLAKRLGAP